MLGALVEKAEIISSGSFWVCPHASKHGDRNIHRLSSRKISVCRASSH